MPPRLRQSAGDLPSYDAGVRTFGLTKGLALLSFPALASPTGSRRGRTDWRSRIMAAEGVKAGGKKKGEMNVDELLDLLHLNEAEEEEVVLAREECENLPAVKWMAVASLLTSKAFSTASLISTMKSAWNPAREVTFSTIDKISL